MKLNTKQEKARSMVCLPLDGLETLDALKSRVKELSPVVGMYKVGKGSFTRFGHDAIKVVQDYGAEVFLDLKFHDIPATVYDASRAASELGVYMFNVHASGGKKMLEAAVEGARDGGSSKVIGVTVLTSIDDEILQRELGCIRDVPTQVENYTTLCNMAGLDGIVCGASDLQNARIRDNLIYVTPGVKGPITEAGADQKRVATPGNAVKWKSNVLVIGRAITGPETPEERLEAGYAILKDMAEYL